MNLEYSQRSPRHQLLRRLGLGSGWLAAYVLSAAALGALLYEFLFATVLLVPVVAEFVIIKSPWTISSFWKGVSVRFAGLAIANLLTYFCYVVPVVYAGGQPWSEEALWAYVVVAVQTVVAAIVLLAVRATIGRKGGAL